VANLTARDHAYKKQCREVFTDLGEHTDFRMHVKNRLNWLGRIQSNQSDISFLQPCSAWLDINVFCNGTVPHWCMDSKGEYAISHANHKNFLGIYNMLGFRTYSDSMLSREIAELCQRCA
jgi:hypothetical protein